MRKTDPYWSVRNLFWLSALGTVFVLSCNSDDGDAGVQLATIGSLLGTDGLCTKSDDGKDAFYYDSGMWLDTAAGGDSGWDFDSGFFNWDSGWASGWDSGWMSDTGTEDTAGEPSGEDTGVEVTDGDSGGETAIGLLPMEEEEEEEEEEEDVVERVEPGNKEAPGDPCSRRGELDVRQGLSCSAVAAPGSLLAMILMIGIAFARRDDLETSP